MGIPGAVQILLTRPFRVRAAFRRELDPDDPAHVRAALAEAGGDGDAWSRRLRNGAAELEAIDRLAEAQGVFGVPSFILDGELFWGTDTLAQIRQKLAERSA